MIFNSLVLLFCIAVLTVGAYSPRFGSFRGYIFNPVFILAILIALYTVDFLLLYKDLAEGKAVVLRDMQVTSSHQIDAAFSVFSSCILALTIAIGLRLLVSENSTLKRKLISTSTTTFGMHTAAASFLIISYSLPVVLLALMDAPSLASITSMRQIYFEDNGYQYFLLSLNLPAAVFLMASNRPLRASRLILIVAHVITLLFVGGRGFIFYLVFAYFGNRALHGRRLGAQYVAIVIFPAFYVLGVARYFLRDYVLGIPIRDFLSQSGGYIVTAFSGIEISLSHALTVIVSSPANYRLEPFESFLAAAIYPVPRALFPAKPLGASTLFSQVTHPEHWAQYRSETLVSGIGDLFMMFGHFAPVFLFLGGLLLASILLRLRSTAYSTQLVTVTYLGILVVVFFRGDLYNTGHYLWALLVYYLGAKMISLVLKATTRNSLAGVRRKMRA